MRIPDHLAPGLAALLGALVLLACAPPPAASAPLPVIGLPEASARGIPCRPTHPSCDQEPWWAVSPPPDDQRQQVTYAFLPAGLQTDARLIQAVWLLWVWDEGQSLLVTAATAGVTIGFAPLSPD